MQNGVGVQFPVPSAREGAGAPGRAPGREPRSPSRGSHTGRGALGPGARPPARTSVAAVAAVPAVPLAGRRGRARPGRCPGGWRWGTRIRPLAERIRRRLRGHNRLLHVSRLPGSAHTPTAAKTSPNKINPRGGRGPNCPDNTQGAEVKSAHWEVTGNKGKAP